MADSNTDRLRVVMGLFRIRQTDICRATGFSRAYLSRLLHEDGFRAGAEFWMRLNNRLADLTREGSAHVFHIDAAPGSPGAPEPVAVREAASCLAPR